MKALYRTVAAAALLGAVAAGMPAAAEDAKITPLLLKPFADMAGGTKEGLMITVDYPPGGSSGIHRHNAHVFVYVLQGALVMQVKGGPLTTVGAGQSFYEGPDDIHAVSRNASTTEPAKFVVFMVKDKGAPPLLPAN
jgi:quercetin dioxygenase-like cupin family protein